MPFDPKIVSDLTVLFEPISYVRVLTMKYAATPLGMGYGRTRFSSPKDAFKLLYIAQDLIPGVAETVIRDRFEGKSPRRLIESEVHDWGAAEVSATAPLSLLNLRGRGLLRLGASTDIARAKGHTEAREFSQMIYDETNLDGILYSSRLTNENCAAIYERAVPGKLDAGPTAQLLTLAELVPGLASLDIELIKT